MTLRVSACFDLSLSDVLCRKFAQCFDHSGKVRLLASASTPSTASSKILARAVSLGEFPRNGTASSPFPGNAACSITDSARPYGTCASSPAPVGRNKSPRSPFMRARGDPPTQLAYPAMLMSWSPLFSRSAPSYESDECVNESIAFDLWERAKTGWTSRD